MFRRRKKRPLFMPDEAVTGIMSTGRPGGGKTTFLRHIVSQLADMGCAVCICCIKPDEADEYARIMPNAIRFTPESDVFNPMVYELSRKGGSVRNLARFHDDLNEVLTRSTSDRTEAFWKNITSDTLSYAIELAYMVKGDNATYADVYEVIMTSPVDMKHAASAHFLESTCAKFLSKALEMGDAKNIADFFLKRLPSVGEKARGAAITGATASISPFVHGDVAKAVVGRSTITPEIMLTGQTILDFDTLTYGQNGLAFQLIMSWFCMEAVLRRKGNFSHFVLVRDEYQMLAHAERDVRTQSVGRSQRFIGISAFQSIPVLEAAFGGSMEAQTQAKAVYGLHANKVMVNNNDHTTNELNAEVLGKERQMFFGGGVQQNQEPNWWDVLGVGGDPSISFNQQYHYRFPPLGFTSLRTGGAENNYTVDAVIHRGNSDFQTVSIRQR